MYRFSALATIVSFLLAFSVTSTAADDPIVTTKVAGNFHDVSHNIRMAITGKGINIAHTLPASDMLTRTGETMAIRMIPILMHASTSSVAQRYRTSSLDIIRTISCYVLSLSVSTAWSGNRDRSTSRTASRQEDPVQKKSSTKLSN